MPLSNPVPRVARHRRAITVEAYLREDGLWDIEARLMDTKPMTSRSSAAMYGRKASRCMTCGCASPSISI